MPGDASSPANFRLDLGYRGAAFFGSQRQPNRRTVQGVLEQALTQLTAQPVALALAGRTDRGVHAVGQVASGQLDWRRPTNDLARGLNAIGPEDLAIYRVRRVDADFHARFSARAREYRYRVWIGPRAPIQLQGFVWNLRRDLDLWSMNEAATMLLGHQDFSSLAGSGRGVPWSSEDCRRTVRLAEWRTLSDPFDPNIDGGRLLEFRIEADGFLPQMVRNAVGSLIEIGWHRREIGWLAQLLAARNRRNAPAAAPAHGLVLWKVRYDGEPVEGVEPTLAPDARGE